MSYTVPRNIRIEPDYAVRLFFDFYVLYGIWFQLVAKNDIYGYKTNDIITGRRADHIDRVFSSVAGKLKKAVIDNLGWSVRREAKHFRYYGPPSSVPNKEYLKYKITEMVGRRKSKLNQHNRNEYERLAGLLERSYYLTRFHKETIPWETAPLANIHAAFLIDGWQDDFGGELWAEATEYLMKLIDSPSLKDDVYLIDRIFDLQHNTGFILNKTGFGYLECESFNRWVGSNFGTPGQMQLLDARFELPLDMLAQAASITVRKIYRSNEHLLDGGITQFYAGRPVEVGSGFIAD